MPKLPKGMFRRAGRPGWYIRLYRGGHERWVSLGTEFGEACDTARALAAGLPVATARAGTVGEEADRWLAGIEDFHVLWMRHTCACQQMEWGGSLSALQQILGHASIETTQRHARLSDEAVMREAASFGRVSGIEA